MTIGALNAGPASVSTTPLIILRWVVATSQLLVVTGAEVMFGVQVPVAPLLWLVAASVAVNVYATNQRRQASEGVALWYFIFDIVQFCGFLFFTGGIDNPFAILLVAPLATASSLLSIGGLSFLMLVTFLCVCVLAFSSYPLDWLGPAPVLTPGYRHGVWMALTVASLFISFVVWRLATEARRIQDALAHTREILEEKRRMSALGALAAAAVHELGSPLGTIAVVTREMERDTHPDDPFAEDIAILRDQTEKCKKILGDLARDPDKKMVELAAPLRFDRLIMEIASAQGSNAHREVAVEVTSPAPGALPEISKTVNLEYGLGNLVGNAISYARERVNVRVEGDAAQLRVVVSDDGPGFAPAVLQSVGQPYISTREGADNHMGLGIFISITLLEAAGAKLVFGNAREGGAVVDVVWPRAALTSGLAVDATEG